MKTVPLQTVNPAQRRYRCYYCGEMTQLAQHVPNGGVVDGPKPGTHQCKSEAQCRIRYRVRKRYGGWPGLRPGR